MSIIDFNSTKNQTIKERFVEREVFGCISTLMERIIKSEKNERFMEREVLGSIITLMEKILKSDQKEGSEAEIFEHAGTLMEGINTRYKNCEILEEIKNLYHYNIEIPDLKNLKINEKIKSRRGDVFESRKNKIINEIKEKIEELKGEEHLSDLMVDDEEISEETNEKIQDQIDERIAELENYLINIENTEREPKKIIEWLHVSNWLHNKLQEKGEPVWNDGRVYIWGRTSTDQAILFDDVISEICKDMEILEGQKNEWKI